MSAVESQMLALGVTAPEFSLPDTEGNLISMRTDARAYLVMFICNHCPFVIHMRAELAKIGRDFLPLDVAVYAINSNDASRYPGDSPDKMKEEIETAGYTFPYLIDASQEIAKAYKAACTPDFFLFDAEKRLVYRGQLDDSRPPNDLTVDGRDLRAAISAVLEGKAIAEVQKPSIGCSIKWRPNNLPDYFG